MSEEAKTRVVAGDPIPVGQYVIDELEARGWDTYHAAERLGGNVDEMHCWLESKRLTRLANVLQDQRKINTSAGKFSFPLDSVQLIPIIPFEPWAFQMRLCYARVYFFSCGFRNSLYWQSGQCSMFELSIRVG